MDSDRQQLLDVLAFESLARRVSTVADESGSLVEHFHLEPRFLARKLILRRENERLRDLLEESAEQVSVGRLSAAALDGWLTGKKGYLLCRRPAGKSLAKQLSTAQRFTDPNHIRLGYHGMLGERVAVITPVNGMLSTDVFARAVFYYIPHRSVAYWSRVVKGRMQFSIELTGDVWKLVEGSDE